MLQYTAASCDLLWFDLLWSGFTHQKHYKVRTGQCTMNKLSKKILRSVLRWRQSHDGSAPCSLALPDGANGIMRKYIPNGAELSTPNKIKAAALYLARTVQFHSVVEENSFHNEAFDILRCLDSMSITMDEERKGRQYRSQSIVLEKAHIRVGQVVKHKTGGYRGVCFAWTMDEVTNTQVVSLLLDWYDYEEILHGALPAVFSAADFEVVTEDTTLRVHHNDIATHFQRFDVEFGCYVPGRSLQYQYPADLAHIVARQRSSFSGTSIAKRADIASGRVVSFSQFVADSIGEALVAEGVVRASSMRPLNSGDLPPTELTTLAARGEEILEDVVSNIQAIKQIIGVTPAEEVVRRSGDRVQDLRRELLAADDCSDTMALLADKYKQQDSAHALLKHLYWLFLSIEQLLVQRYQCLGGASHFLSLAPLLVADSKGVVVSRSIDCRPAPCENREDSEMYAPLPEDHVSPAVTFKVGQVLRHKLFNYRGVCAGWDIRPSVDTSLWEGVKDSQLGTEQPYYRIIADTDDIMRTFGTPPRDIYYVAQENLEALEPPESGVVNNPHTAKFFREFDFWTGRFTCRDKLLFAFDPDCLAAESPDDGSELGSDGLEDRERKRDLQCIETALLKAYAQLEGILASGNIGTNPRLDSVELFRNCGERKVKRDKLSDPKKFIVNRQKVTGGNPRDGVGRAVCLRNSDLLSLLQAAPDRQAAHVIENIKWVCWMITPDRQCARYMREGVSKLARGRNEEALALFRAAMTLQPALTEVYNKISAICYVRQEYASAVVNANMALKFDSKHYAASAMLGLALMKTNRNYMRKEREIRTALERALHYNPWLGSVATKLVQIDIRKAKQQQKRGTFDCIDERVHVSRSDSGGSLTIL